MGSDNTHSARLLKPTKATSFWDRLRQRSFFYHFFRVCRRPLFSLAVFRERWYECHHPDQPLIVPSVLPFLEQNINDSDVGIEWGSGGSTAWLAARCHTVVSIEDSPEWFAHIEESLQADGVTNVDYRLIPLTEMTSEGVLNCFPRYVLEVAGFDDNHFNFCLVDGRLRQACVLLAIPKIKPGGLLIVDDTHGMPVDEWGIPQEWRIAFQGRTTLKETTVWRKPI